MKPAMLTRVLFGLMCLIQSALTVTALALTAMATTAMAATDNPAPRELAAWSDWVLRDTPELSCAILYNANEHVCAYPATLKFDITSNGGGFVQQWLVQQNAWIHLPGDAGQWPLQVTVNQKPAIVILRNGHPAVYLPPGTHRVAGRFSWAALPKFITVPEASGLVFLTLNQRSIEQPDLRNGQLWLKESLVAPQENNRLNIQVFRKITDSIPVHVTTSIALDVSGQPRELKLAGALLQNFTPAAINSRLPARIDQKGMLYVQVRPGRWIIDIEALHLTSLEHYQLPHLEKPWPEQEVWAFDQQSHLRTVKITNQKNIDPTQTQLPEEWKTLPAYSLTQGDNLDIQIIKRGNPDPEPDQLNLNRVLWLDFDGAGITVKDSINGTLSQHWRLNAQPELKLGQVTLDGQPQFITRLPKQEAQGVEIRQGNVAMQADSRVLNNIHDISASGWDNTFNSVSAELNLPVGYRLIHVRGGHAADDWWNRWTLLDFFMVLIISMAVLRLWGKGWGVLALFTLTITWHETLAPQYIWLNLIVATALLRTLSEGRLLRWLKLYRNITALALVTLLLAYAVVHLRFTLYPQLEQEYTVQQTPFAEQELSAPAPAAAMSEAMESSIDESYSKLSRFKKDVTSKPEGNIQNQMQIDPNALIQTGPGLPNWQWQRYRIDWDGPVDAQQRLQLILMSPFMFRVFNLLSIVLIGLLAWRLMDVAALTASFKARVSHAPVVAFSALMSGLIVAGMALPTPAFAEYPSAKLLKDLQTYLSKPKDCLPECASIESMAIQINSQTLKLDLRVHAKEDVAIPLPVPIQKWTPNQVSLNGQPAAGLFRRQDQYLWLRVAPGNHRISIEGKVSHLNQIKMDFMLKPHAFEIQANGWVTDGMDASNNAINVIALTRIVTQQTTQSGKNTTADLPVFAVVTRHLELALDWTLNTTVQYQSGTALPAILRIPLLQNESVISEGIKVEKGFAVITLNDNRREVSWRSTLTPTASLQWVASDNKMFREIWQLNASPIWHVTYEGIPVIYHQREGQFWQPEWQPWPQESVTLNITRPEGVPGNTLTIDRSQLSLTPGENITTAELQLSLRTSLGGQHDIRLPATAELLSVEMDGNSLPLHITAGVLALPLTPGAHQANIKWREPRGVGWGKFVSSDVDLGVPHVNTSISITPGYQRWILFTGGPLLGPAVLFWGVLGVIVILAIGLSRIKDVPLSWPHWVLLGIGLSTTSPAAAVLVVAWIFALRWRGQTTMPTSAKQFNQVQLGLLLLTILALATLLFAVQQGLLGTPDMQITGNQSSSYLLNWFSDRNNSTLPQAWMITVPVTAYRILMLLWSIWLAFALIKWLRWGWSCYVHQGYWLNRPAKIKVSEEKNKSE